MPKRVIDFDAMWGSDKLASCAEWAQAEYAWLYGLADASGCFELTNLRVIWGRVAAIRRNLTIERLEQIFDEFQDKGLLFVWAHEGKRYGHWSGSDVPGRLPPPSWRMRLERLAPLVPKKQFAEYMSRFARGRATLPGGSFRAEPDQTEGNFKFESSDFKSHRSVASGSFVRRCNKKSTERLGPMHANVGANCTTGLMETRESRSLHELKGDLEEGQAQDWNWDLDSERKVNRDCSHDGEKLKEKAQTCGYREIRESPSPSQLNLPQGSSCRENSNPVPNEPRIGTQRLENTHAMHAAAGVVTNLRTGFQARDKSAFVVKELAVGRGPSCGPVKVKPEALERIRMRDAALKGSRAP